MSRLSHLACTPNVFPAGLVFGAGTPVTNSHIGALIPQMLGQPLANLFQLDGSGLGQVMLRGAVLPPMRVCLALSNLEELPHCCFTPLSTCCNSSSPMHLSSSVTQVTHSRPVEQKSSMKPKRGQAAMAQPGGPVMTLTVRHIGDEVGSEERRGEGREGHDVLVEGGREGQ